MNFGQNRESAPGAPVAPLGPMRIRLLFEDAFRDLRYAGRMLTRGPLFSLVAIFSLALGIGGAASVFTVLNAIVLRNLPVPNPQELKAVEKVGTNQRHGRFSWPRGAHSDPLG